MSEHKSPIPSMIYNAAVGGHVTNSQQVLDEILNREQGDINQETVGAVPYNTNNPNGMGRIVLKKNDNFKEVVEKQTNGNTVFVIKYDFTLTGNVIVPTNCVLEFDGGSISGNGTDKNTITGNNTRIKTSANCFKEGLSFNGTWNIPYICDDMFDTASYGDDDLVVDAINKLQNPSIFNLIEINKEYHLDTMPETTYGSNNAGFVIRSNIRFVLNNTIYIKANSFSNYFAIYIIDANNVEVSGGKTVGDVETHIGTKGEYGYGIFVKCSKNVYIHDIECSKFWGDGINVNGSAESNVGDYTTNSEAVLLERVTCDNNRRQGLSIEHVVNCTVRNSRFTNTGAIKSTNPSRGIDIEPTQNDNWRQCCKEITIDNCYFDNNLNGDILLACTYPNSIGNVYLSNMNNINVSNSFSNVTISNCTFYYFAIEGGTNDNINNVKINNCEFFRNTRLYNEPKEINAEFNNCIFKPSTTITIIEKSGFQTHDNVVFRNCTFITKQNESTLYKVGTVNWCKYINCYFDFGNNRLTPEGGSLYNCIIKAKDIGINFGCPTAHVIDNCYIDTISNENIIYIYNGATSSTWEFLNNIYVNKDVQLFKRDNSWSSINGGKIGGKISNNQLYYLPVLFTMGGTVKNTLELEQPYTEAYGATRPTARFAGQVFFDTNLSPARPIWWNGSAWIDATGTEV